MPRFKNMHEQKLVMALLMALCCLLVIDKAFSSCWGAVFIWLLWLPLNP